MRKLYFLLVFWSANVFAASVDPLSLPLKKLDQHIQRQIQQEKAIGCAIAVVSEGKIVFIKAYGVRKKGEKASVDLNTVFQLGSVSKPISASLIARLQKQKLVSVKDPVVEYCPHFLPETTLQHVLSHTSGYSRAGWNSKIEAGRTRAQLLASFAKSQQKTPGETFDYHNVVYSLVEEVIENTCHQPFNEALQENLFRPLHMTRTSVGYPDFEAEQNRAWAHQENKNHRWQASKQCSHRYHEAVCASAGINSTIMDMAKFLQLQMGGNPEFLTSQELADFHAPLIVAPDAINWFPEAIQSYYGQGWRIIDCPHGRLVFHGGWVKGFRNFIGFIPDQNLGIVILHNAESNFSFKTALMFFNEWAKAK
ncbi:MAG: beta-lactamase family protein [Proteobacteria bacterium]|nr:beta-lactamase family protein [Pseudomonadota bacterium]